CPAEAELNCPMNADCGCTWVDGIAERKQAITAAGASIDFLASAMMETDDLTTNYPRGDNKSGDAFNAGLCKQNLAMIRSCHPAIQSESQAEVMNTDLALDIQVYGECRAQFGDNWYYGHRQG